MTDNRARDTDTPEQHPTFIRVEMTEYQLLMRAAKIVAMNEELSPRRGKKPPVGK